ncbi:MAG: DUF1285 domain-containing protein [Rhodospirillales bacterium]|nr:DUF1285 domain-containing protein [Rhodospirillales bacterium]
MTAIRGNPSASAGLADRPDPVGGDSHSAGVRSDGGPVCGDLAIRIARDGTWFYHGSPIGRKPLVKLFASVLRRMPNGDYWLVTPAERGRIQVDDAPFTAVELTVAGTGPVQTLTFRTNLDHETVAGPGRPIRVVIHPDTGEPSPYVYVDEGLEALIVRAVFYQLVDLGVEERVDGAARFGVWSAGAFFPLDGGR